MAEIYTVNFTLKTKYCFVNFFLLLLFFMYMFILLKEILGLFKSSTYSI